MTTLEIYDLGQSMTDLGDLLKTETVFTRLPVIYGATIIYIDLRVSGTKNERIF